uniref:Uncharacterized protein n=1 Tax=Anopheles maculatus TaxID=74869 RepID=A0A182SFE7_9DIPT
MANQTNQSLKSNNPSSVPPSPALTPSSATSTEPVTKDSSINRSARYDRSQPVASRPASLPMVSAYSGVSPGTAMSSRPSRSATRPVGVGSNPFTSQTAGMRVFKKCKSATFQIDGHTYTIGLPRMELIRRVREIVPFAHGKLTKCVVKKTVRRSSSCCRSKGCTEG